MISSSLLEKLVLGKKIDSHNKDKLRIVVLCDLECQAIIPLLNYELKILNYYPDVFDLHYSDYQSFLTIYGKEISKFEPDVFLIIQDNSYYFDENQIVFPIERVSKNIEVVTEKTNQVIGMISQLVNQAIIFTTTLPYREIDKKQYISLTHRQQFDQGLRNFAHSITSQNSNTHLLDMDRYDDSVIELIYDHHNSVATLTFLDFIVIEFVQAFRVYSGKSIKCVITDLDNTLWDGVIADTNPDEVFKSKKARYFFTYQKWLSALYQQGIILCIASKNDEAFIKTIFEKYANILQVQWDQFNGKAINWQNKSVNIKYLCQFLNISEEHVLFIDDSRYEYEEVKFNLPKISVFQLSDDMQESLDRLINADFFRKQQLTETDYLRNQTYSENIKREDSRKTLGNEEDFLKNCNIVLSFIDQVSSYIDRVSDLSLRTNQFNMTSKRFNVAEVKAFIDNPLNKVIIYSCKDRFGDYGIIGCAFLLFHQDVCEIVNLVMSCRVFGRQVEYALMDIIIHNVKNSAAKKIIATYKETAKNKKFENFYETCGFVKNQKENNYELDLGQYDQRNNHPYVNIVFE